MKVSCLLIALLLIVSSCRKKIEPKIVDTMLDCGIELHAIDALNKDTMVAVGGERYLSGSIFVTHDGGLNWIRFENISEKGLYACKWINANRVEAGGVDGKYYQSTDGGVNWNLTQLYFWGFMRAIESTGAYTWLAGGNGLRTGFVTHDNGFGVSQMQHDTFQNEMRSVLFVDSNNLYAAGYGLILRSNDMGNTWQSTSAEGDFFIGMTNINGVVYAAGMNGTVLESTDNGTTWSHAKRGNSPAKLNTIWNAFDGNQNGLVIGGENGKIFYYDFDKWYKLDIETNDDITGITLVDKLIFCSTRQGRVLRMELP